MLRPKPQEITCVFPFPSYLCPSASLVNYFSKIYWFCPLFITLIATILIQTTILSYNLVQKLFRYTLQSILPNQALLKTLLLFHIALKNPKLIKHGYKAVQDMILVYLYDLIFYQASLLLCSLLLWTCHISCSKALCPQFFTPLAVSLIIYTSAEMLLFLITQFRVFYPQSNSPLEESALLFL